MANRDIVATMSSVLDDYEAGRIRPLEVEKAIQFNIAALEALPYSRIKEAETLCFRLVIAHMFDDDEEFIRQDDVAKVIAEFRKFLSLLPTENAG